jgi:mycothiol synthase
MFLPELNTAKFQVLHPELADLEAITSLISMAALAESGDNDVSKDDLRNDWARQGFDLGQDAWKVVTIDDKQIMGYVDLWNRSNHAYLMADGYVHPEFTGQGNGRSLLRLIEDRAAGHLKEADPRLRVFILNGVDGANKNAVQLHEKEGYQPSQYFFRMKRQMENLPQSPDWPPGINWRPYQLGEEQAVFEVIAEAFPKNWGPASRGFEEWKRRMERDRFDPSLWFIAWQADKIAGCSLCHIKGETGWVNQLAVRTEWRKKGLGMALLQQSFREFYSRNIKTVALGVDAANPTGATRLYEKAGMQVVHRYIVFEKVLREGIDVRTIETEVQ